MSTDTTASDPVGALLAVLDDVVDYGTAWATKSGAMTMPAQARKTLGLPAESNWRVFGSPSLGVALVLAPGGDPRETLALMLREASLSTGQTHDERAEESPEQVGPSSP